MPDPSVISEGRGGRRPGAGRPKGSRNRPREVIEAEKAAIIAARIAKGGKTATDFVYVRKKAFARPCVSCGQDFMSKMPVHHARYCSDTCRRLASYKSDAYGHVCKACGAQFVTRQRKASCCSQKCVADWAKIVRERQIAANPPKETRHDQWRRYAYLRRAVTASARADRFKAEEIFERDGWKCGICQRRVKKHLVWPDPESASLDHITPISKGGQHVRENVQLAHFRCNSSKSNGAGGQLLLFG